MPESAAVKTSLAFVGLALSLLTADVRVAGMPDFSGAWQTSPDQAVILSRVDSTPGGWGGALQGLRAHRPYTISITQSAETIWVAFPGGSGSFLNGGVYQLDGDQATTTRSIGDYWIKVVTRGTWDGQVLTLAATRLVDWWSRAQPSDVVRQATQLETVHVLRFQTDRTGLIVDTILADEKGRVEYRMVFTRRTP